MLGSLHARPCGIKRRSVGAFHPTTQLTYHKELHGHKLETFLLETLDDLTDQAPLDTIGLDGNEGTLLSHDAEKHHKYH